MLSKNDFTNKLFLIDNLELLKSLPSNSIDLIFCDILYNTGKHLMIMKISLEMQKKLWNGMNQD